MAALHDGQRYAIEKMAISIVTGMSMTNTTAPMRRTPVTLLAGVALPGPVVEKMMHLSATPASDNLSARSGFARNIQTRAWRTRAETTVSELAADGRQRALEAFRASLALPGVKVEIAALSNILQGKTLLDAGFTVDQFQHALQSNDYRIVHIASHGVFGDSAEASFIMAYDDVLACHPSSKSRCVTWPFKAVSTARNSVCVKPWSKRSITSCPSDLTGLIGKTKPRWPACRSLLWRQSRRVLSKWRQVDFGRSTVFAPSARC
jgi:CHAT domain-containing protein